MKKIKDYNKEELENILSISTSYSDFLNRINYAKSSSNYKYTKNYLDKLGIDYSIVERIRWTTKERGLEVFTNNSNYNTKSLKSKLLKYNLLNYECSICGNKGQWLNKSLSLHLDHIDGINNNNELSNLRFLCPNCHSQTDTYSGKNKK